MIPVTYSKIKVGARKNQKWIDGTIALTSKGAPRLVDEDGNLVTMLPCEWVPGFAPGSEFETSQYLVVLDPMWSGDLPNEHTRVDTPVVNGSFHDPIHVPSGASPISGDAVQLHPVSRAAAAAASDVRPVAAGKAFAPPRNLRPPLTSVSVNVAPTAQATAQPRPFPQHGSQLARLVPRKDAFCPPTKIDHQADAYYRPNDVDVPHVSSSKWATQSAVKIDLTASSPLSTAAQSPPFTSVVADGLDRTTSHQVGQVGPTIPTSSSLKSRQLTSLASMSTVRPRRRRMLAPTTSEAVIVPCFANRSEWRSRRDHGLLPAPDVYMSLFEGTESADKDAPAEAPIRTANSADNTDPAAHLALSRNPCSACSVDTVADVPQESACEGGVHTYIDPFLTRQLRSHQRSGAAHILRSCLRYGGAILADEMGLGKTLTVIAAAHTLLHRAGGDPYPPRKGSQFQARPLHSPPDCAMSGLRKDSVCSRSMIAFNASPAVSKVLVVVPSSLASMWSSELRRWLGDSVCKPVVLGGTTSPDTRKKKKKKKKRKIRISNGRGWKTISIDNDEDSSDDDETAGATTSGGGNVLRQLREFSASKESWLICTFGMLRRHADALGNISFGLVIVDEAHQLRNERTRLVEALIRVAPQETRESLDESLSQSSASLCSPSDSSPQRCVMRILITGTPIQNASSDLEAILVLCVPPLCRPPSSCLGYTDPAKLRRFIGHLMVRRTCAATFLNEGTLPPRFEHVIYLATTVPQATWYRALCDAVLKSSSRDEPGVDVISSDESDAYPDGEQSIESGSVRSWIATDSEDSDVVCLPRSVLFSKGKYAQKNVLSRSSPSLCKDVPNQAFFQDCVDDLTFESLDDAMSTSVGIASATAQPPSLLHSSSRSTPVGLVVQVSSALNACAVSLERRSNILGVLCALRASLMMSCTEDQLLKRYSEAAVSRDEGGKKQIITLKQIDKLQANADLSLDPCDVRDIPKFNFVRSLLVALRENHMQRGESRSTRPKVVVVSGFTKVLDVVDAVAISIGYKCLRLDGSTSVKKRGGIVRSFQEASVCGPEVGTVLTLSSRAGGVGLTLTAADHMVIIDPDWNPAVDSQCIGRVWRDGSAIHPFVTVYRLVVDGTIETEIIERQQKKLRVAAAAGCATIPVKDGGTEYHSLQAICPSSELTAESDGDALLKGLGRAGSSSIAALLRPQPSLHRAASAASQCATPQELHDVVDPSFFSQPAVLRTAASDPRLLRAVSQSLVTRLQTTVFCSKADLSD